MADAGAGTAAWEHQQLAGHHSRQSWAVQRTAVRVGSLRAGGGERASQGVAEGPAGGVVADNHARGGRGQREDSGGGRGAGRAVGGGRGRAARARGEVPGGERLLQGGVRSAAWRARDGLARRGRRAADRVGGVMANRRASPEERKKDVIRKPECLATFPGFPSAADRDKQTGKVNITYDDRTLTGRCRNKEKRMLRAPEKVWRKSKST